MAESLGHCNRGWPGTSWKPGQNLEVPRSETSLLSFSAYLLDLREFKIRVSARAEVLSDTDQGPSTWDCLPHIRGLGLRR